MPFGGKERAANGTSGFLEAPKANALKMKFMAASSDQQWLGKQANAAVRIRTIVLFSSQPLEDLSIIIHTSSF